MFPTVILLLLAFVAYSSADPCSVQPCYNGGTCVPQGNTYTCNCPGSYTGQNCGYIIECHPGQVDVFFVVDSTGSIGRDDFNYSRAFIAGLVGEMQIANNRSQVGLNQFGRSSYTPAFYLNTYRSKAQIVDAVWNIPYYDASATCISCGMLEAVNVGFTSGNGDRSDYPDVMVLITDGKQNTGSHSVSYAHSQAAAKNISVIAIGVGGGIDLSQLQAATGDPSKVFTIDSFPNITIITGEVCHAIQVVHPCGSSPCANGGSCNEFGSTYNCSCVYPWFGPQCHQYHKCASHPCQNGGTCNEVGSIYTCTCPPGYTGQNCQHRLPCFSNPCQHGGTCHQQANFTYSCTCPPGYTGPRCQNVVGCHPNNIDLVFVADSSGSIGTADFQLVLSFLNDLVNQAVVGQNQTRIGMAEFSSSPRYVMFLNSFWLASQVKAAIRNTPYIGLGTNIASGMNYALDTLFNPLYGSRPDHRRVMIVLTDGQDGSDVRSAHAKAQSMGIYTVAIGVGVATDYQELVTIAGNPNHVTNINSFANLTSLTAWTCHQILGN